MIAAAFVSMHGLGAKTRARLLSLAVLLLCPLPFISVALGQAGGLYLPENGGPIGGTAQAGSSAVARDAETAWTNPAGMTRLDSAEIMLAVMPLGENLEFKPSPETTIRGSAGGNQGAWLPGIALFAAVGVHERVALGFSFTIPAGLVADPEDDWVGRTWTIDSSLFVINLEPSIGVRLTDCLSLGAGLDIQYMTFAQSLVGPLPGNALKVDGDSWQVSFSASALWEPAETTRVGLRYRYRVSHDLSGDLTLVENTAPVSTSFTLPMSLTASLYQAVSDSVALLLDVGWTDWSDFDRNVIAFDESRLAVELPRDFKDTWNVSAGAHIWAIESLLVMLGVGYVSSAVDDAKRTPDMPVDQQVRGSVGLEYHFNQHWMLGGNYTFAWLGNNTIDQSRRINGIVGDYTANLHVIGVNAAVDF